MAAARALARLALLCVAGAVAAVVAGAGQWLILLLGLAGLAVAGAGIWWALAHRGIARLLGALLAVAAPVGVLVLYAASGLWLVAVTALAAVGGRAGLRQERTAPTAAPRSHALALRSGRPAGRY